MPGQVAGALRAVESVTRGAPAQSRIAELSIDATGSAFLELCERIEGRSTATPVISYEQGTWQQVSRDHVLDVVHEETAYLNPALPNPARTRKSSTLHCGGRTRFRVDD